MSERQGPDTPVDQVLRDRAQEAVDAWKEAYGISEPSMVTKAVLVVEAVGLDGRASILSVATDSALHDLMGMIEAAKVGLRDRFRYAQMMSDPDQEEDDDEQE